MSGLPEADRTALRRQEGDEWEVNPEQTRYASSKAQGEDDEKTDSNQPAGHGRGGNSRTASRTLPDRRRALLRGLTPRTLHPQVRFTSLQQPRDPNLHPASAPR